MTHEVELKADGSAKTVSLSDLPKSSRGNLWKLSLVDDFGFNACIKEKDVQGIAIVADNNDGWQIDSIVTYIAANEYNWKLSSVDLDAFKWVDQNFPDPSHKQFQLNLLI